MKNTNRYIVLALCFTLTLGAFAYRPPKAEAVAGVDDAVVIGALLTAFAGGIGLIFSNNGMTSREIADGMAQKWANYKATLGGAVYSFAGWLGYEDMDALLADCKVTAGNVLEIPKAMALKFKEFTEWFVKDAGLVADGKPSTVISNPSLLSRLHSSYCHDPIVEGSEKSLKDVYPVENWATYAAFYSPSGTCGPYENRTFHEFLICSTAELTLISIAEESYLDGYGSLPSGVYLLSNNKSSFSVKFFCFANGTYNFMNSGANTAASYYRLCNYSPDIVTDGADTDLSVVQKPGTASPDFAGDGTVGMTDAAWDASTIEELLQQILAQVEANTLAPTLEGVDTDTGGDTGTDTDEDAKPYLPYIPRIFEKIGELPNLIAEKIGAFFTTLWGWLSNIITEIKALPAAIAQKISSAFSALWDWLSDIVTAIKAIPAAIAEKVKALFVPHEGYAAEFVDSITATYQGRMGLLTYPFTVLADFVGTVATLEEQEPVLRWDAVVWQNKTIIAAGEYNLKSAVSNTQMQTAYTIYKTVISGALVVAFLHLCYKKLKEVQQN